MSETNQLKDTTPQQNLTTRIAGDVVNRATADLPDDQRSAIRRLHAHYVENNLTLAETGKLIDYSDATITTMFRGKFEGSLVNVTQAIIKYFDLADERSTSSKLPFIKTSLTERIWKVCGSALEFQKIAFIFGDQQIGKTAALKAYRDEHNHGSTIYVRMPTGGALSNFLIELARALRIGENLSISRVRERIKKAFDSRMLLIVDEAHLCIKESGRSQRSVESIDFVREIFDETECGVVLCATNVFSDAMESGTLHKILRQTKRRRLCALQLPRVPRQEDLNTFAAAYGLPASSGAARELEHSMVDAEAIGMWLTLLRMGAKVAAKRKEKLNWSHVITAHAGLRELEQAK
jgi:hypothetical protein